MAQFRDYLIAVKTASMPNAQTASLAVYLTLGGTFGQSTRYGLNKSSEIGTTTDIQRNNDPNTLVPQTQAKNPKFGRANEWDLFKIRTADVGTLLDIRVELASTDAWCLEKVIVIPYKYPLTVGASGALNLDVDQLAVFTARRWFDSKDFDNNQDLCISCDYPPGSATVSDVVEKVTPIPTPIVLRYDNTDLGSDGTADDVNILTTFTVLYSVVQGVAIDDSTATDAKSTMSHSWGVEVSAKTEAKVAGTGATFEAKATASGTYGSEISKACQSQFGATTTTTIEQTQEIPIRVKKNSAVTLIVMVYQTATKYDVGYEGYKVPITVYSGTADLSFKLFKGILDAAAVDKEVTKLNDVALRKPKS